VPKKLKSEPEWIFVKDGAGAGAETNGFGSATLDRGEQLEDLI
jgi:hypothetical protein